MDGLIQALGTSNPSGHARHPSGHASNPSGRARHRFQLSGKALRLIPLFITTTLLAAGCQNLCAQDVTPKEPPTTFPNQNTTPAAPSTPQLTQAPDAQSPEAQSPDLSTIPHASPLPPDQAPAIADVASDNPQTRHGDIGYASGNVVVTYGDHVLRADSITYDHSTETITAEGNVELSGGSNDEHISASRAI